MYYGMWWFVLDRCDVLLFGGRGALYRVRCGLIGGLFLWCNLVYCAMCGVVCGYTGLV